MESLGTPEQLRREGQRQRRPLVALWLISVVIIAGALVVAGLDGSGRGFTIGAGATLVIVVASIADSKAFPAVVAATEPEPDRGAGRGVHGDLDAPANAVGVGGETGHDARPLPPESRRCRAFPTGGFATSRDGCGRTGDPSAD